MANTHALAGKKVLVTGASGFIGKRLVESLLAHGADVVTLRRKDSPVPRKGRSVVGDYADVEGLTEVIRLEKPDFVYHVAGATKGVRYDDFRLGNVMPTENLLRAIREGHPAVKRLVHVSSLTVFGPSTKDRPKTEGDPREPIEFYGKSKLEAEQVVESFDDLAWTIIRPAGVYGPGDVDYLNLFKSAAQGVNLFYGNRDKVASHVYVDDVVRALVECALVETTIGKGYFVCDGHPVTWGTYQDHLVRHSGRRVLTLDLPAVLVPLAARAGEIVTAIDKKPRLFNQQKAKMGAQDAWTCTHEAAKRDFGYSPLVLVDEGIRRTFAWYREQGWL